MREIKLFYKYSFDGVVVSDPSLKSYINLTPIFVPRTFGRNEAKKFWKSKMNIVERFINKLMTPGHRGKKHLWSSKHCTGKAYTVLKIVKEAFEIIEEKTKENPVQVLVRAVERASPREEITSIEYGGIRQPKAVDTSPQRRVDLAMRWMVQGAHNQTINKKASMVRVLANMIIKCAEGDPGVFAIKKKNELERQAAASR